MDFKTGLTAFTIATSPINANAQKKEVCGIVEHLEPYYIEYVVDKKDSLANPNLISYKDIHYMDGYAGISQTYNEYFVNPNILKNNGQLKPASFRKPNPKMANKEMVTKTKTTFVYDEYGNVSEIKNAKGQTTRRIERDQKGYLWNYTDITYKNNKKSLEQVYDSDKELMEAREFHNNGTATVTSFNSYGEAQFEGLYKTSIVNGEEVVSSKRWWID